MTSLPAVPRRLSTAVAGLLVATGGLVSGAGAASAAPADPDLTGAVTSAAGAPVAGIEVTAFTVAGNGAASIEVEKATTGADGRYTFVGLDPDSLAGSGKPAAARFKLRFTDLNPSTESLAAYRSLGYETRFLGGTLSSRNSLDVPVPAGGTGTAPTERLVQYGGIQVTVLDPAGSPVTDYGFARALNTENEVRSDSSTTADDAYYGGAAAAPRDGVVLLKYLTGGQRYKVFGGGQDFDSAANLVTYFLPKYAADAFTLETATEVPVVAGQYTAVTIRLSDGLTNVALPRIVGNASFGSRLTALPGTWARNADTEYTYQWLRGSSVVGTGSSYLVTAADRKARLRVVVTAYNADYTGTAASLPTEQVGEVSKVRARRIAGGLVSVDVRAGSRRVARRIGPATGKVMLVTTDGVKASKRLRLSDGAAVLEPNGRATGTLTVVYLGGGRLGPDTATVESRKGDGKRKGGQKKQG